MKRFRGFFLFCFVAACVSFAFSYRYYGVDVAKVPATELEKITLRSGNPKEYPNLNGIELHHLPGQRVRFCAMECNDMKAVSQELAALKEELAHCRSGDK